MYKIPVSVLVVIHTADLQVLLLERADHPGYWQSVTGSQDSSETLTQTAAREVFEETGLNVADYALTDWQTENRYEIYEEWRWRYGPDVRFNTEHVFGLSLPGILPIRIAAREHLNFMWLPWQQAADKVFSSSNADAIRHLPERQNLQRNNR
ncbi:dihydroneopterin triphosphate diphosphatase [Nitrosomonas sp. Is35]|uniref:dihydroneopterin triphosphate diphosphatase n=1 Tax=Nitrosomonas sp. Is35 TaxID=3080534 RepID=UPI00294B922A|nr:dihydroneopterin triphosphate diphosphatase [Nitrosomonas sp. Is35]MDV6347591.1 dihydroneopterin triphosphate diphosphatase [Nitrosomonas sp. Is35]